jgi:hypothetical protein
VNLLSKVNPDVTHALVKQSCNLLVPLSSPSSLTTPPSVSVSLPSRSLKSSNLIAPKSSKAQTLVLPPRPPSLILPSTAKISWSFKLYGENILRKDVRSKQTYPAKLCEELKACEKLTDLEKKPIVADAPFW